MLLEYHLITEDDRQLWLRQRKSNGCKEECKYEKALFFWRHMLKGDFKNGGKLKMNPKVWVL